MANPKNPPSLETNNELNDELPIVFYCSKCNAIIGDSMSWLDSNEDLQIFILSRVTQKVTAGEKLLTSSEGGDLGSTFVQLWCSRCETVIGKMYKTTPRCLDQMRDSYSINVNSVESYQIGSAEQSVTTEDLLTVPQAKIISSKLADIQSVMLAMHNRIQKLEESANISYHNGFLSPNHSQNKENVLR